ncbi:unnamed protein product [Bursaphelenchus okinawaensis]|uniref:Uncharacterized protein n=1 Tax=Bursaphelenchus okinawaensis TaxID=465554 RepID=A0A811KC81_9BILA|nr:unnamed protein product [Bursaphelenchus okinawaensis]CAG9096369.1 unnamed protein product [Bursaphelenchus okinawaensis]
MKTYEFLKNLSNALLLCNYVVEMFDEKPQAVRMMTFTFDSRAGSVTKHQMTYPVFESGDYVKREHYMTFPTDEDIKSVVILQHNYTSFGGYITKNNKVCHFDNKHYDASKESERCLNDGHIYVFNGKFAYIPKDLEDNITLIENGRNRIVNDVEGLKTPLGVVQEQKMFVYKDSGNKCKQIWYDKSVWKSVDCERKKLLYVDNKGRDMWYSLAYISLVSNCKIKATESELANTYVLFVKPRSSVYIILMVAVPCSLFIIIIKFVVVFVCLHTKFKKRDSLTQKRLLTIDEERSDCSGDYLTSTSSGQSKPKKTNWKKLKMPKVMKKNKDDLSFDDSAKNTDNPLGKQKKPKMPKGEKKKKKPKANGSPKKPKDPKKNGNNGTGNASPIDKKKAKRKANNNNIIGGSEE